MSRSPEKSFAVQCACDEVEAKTLSAYAAAKKYHVAESSVGRALKRRKNVCPTCGQQCLAHMFPKGE